MQKNLIITYMLIFNIATITGTMIEIDGPEHLDAIKKQYSQRVIAFVKPSCPHCKKIEQPFAEVANNPELQHVAFAHIQTSNNKNKKITAAYGISTVPHFFIECGDQKKESKVPHDNSFAQNLVQEIMHMCPKPESAHTQIDTDVTVVIADLPTTYPFSLPKLAYAYNALEPHIDARTMQIHYEKHHQAYVDNLNAALKDHPKLQQKKLKHLLKHLDNVPSEIRNAVRNNGGGHMNHSFFWNIMQPNAQAIPEGRIVQEINKQFGSFAAFKEKFNATAKTVFGSGWAWLVTDKHGKLSIIATHNQDSPLSEHQTPILGLDVWEHAYYLAYQNRRMDYITAWWHVINWQQVEHYYMDALHPKKKCCDRK